jgi:tRNA(Arg) A34 adenosine deaminase TadA
LYVQRWAEDLFAIHLDPARFNQFFTVAPRGHACAGQNFSDPIALWCFICHGPGLDCVESKAKRGKMGFNSQMGSALIEARKAAEAGEVPVGAVLVDPRGEIVARAGNRTRRDCDPTAHAEILVIRAAAAALGQERLGGYTLYVTLEPCAMCAGALAHARISRVVYGAADPKSGGTDHGARVFSHAQSHHRPEVIGGISEEDCAALLQNFFAQKRS